MGQNLANLVLRLGLAYGDCEGPSHWVWLALAGGWAASAALWWVLLRRLRLAGPAAPRRGALPPAERMGRLALHLVLAFTGLLWLPLFAWSLLDALLLMFQPAGCGPRHVLPDLLFVLSLLCAAAALLIGWLRARERQRQAAEGALEP